MILPFHSSLREPDAGKCLLAACLVLLAVTANPRVAHGQRQLALAASQAQVGQYEKIEFRITVERTYQNPFNPDEVELNLALRTPNGANLNLPAFFGQLYERDAKVPAPGGVIWMYPQGLPVWQARFAPAEVGQYQATASLKDRDGVLTSAPVTFSCTASQRPGFIRVSRKDPRYFEFSTGEPFFPIGQNLAFIGPSQHVSLPKVSEIFEKLAANGANYLRIWTCCQDWALAVEARKSAWGRSWDWHPPLVPMSDAGEISAGSADRKCLKFSAGAKGTLAVAPSHAVALRPRTNYVLTGRLKTTPDASVRINAGRQAFAPPVGAKWADFRCEFATAANEYWLGQTSLQVQGGTAWLDGLSLQEAAGGPELLWEADVNRPERGYYNPLDCAILDDVVTAAEKYRLYLQLCLITRDVYMSAQRDAQSAAYQQAIADARKLLRYAVARWGYSTSVATWEYFNENDPGLPTDPFFAAVGKYLEQVDLYRHLRQTSTWAPCPRDCRHPQLDVADVHFYLRAIKDPPYPDEVAAAQGQAKFLREHAPRKPALIAEFGLANEKWQPTKEMETSDSLADFHNGLWASALSGTSGTALFWWWDRFDKRGVYPQYRPLADFLAGIPWTTAGLETTTATASEDRLRLVGLQSRERCYFWLFDPRASWNSVVIRRQTPPQVAGVEVTVRDLTPGSYRLQWWDTWAGKIVKEQTLTVSGAALQLSAPPFSRDLACKLERGKTP